MLDKYKSSVNLLAFLTKDNGHSLRKGLNIDFDPRLNLLNAGILSRKLIRRTVNDGSKRKASEYITLTTEKNEFYASLTLV